MFRVFSALASILLLAPCLAAEKPSARFTPVPIPVLDSKGDVYKTEGVTDPLIYQNALGRKSIIMVYVDFADAEMDVDTRDRANQVLGGKRFDELFDEQSHGKVSFDIRHVHGWRRMPGKSGDYSSATTESHRELFVQVFKLYPEINFLDYDYIVANMPRIGNTAFGEREDLAIPYRDRKIKVALNLSSPTPYVLAHELAHLMGLPDLYTYAGIEGPKNPAGPWDIMSQAGNSSGFLGWHQHKLEWLDAERKTYLANGSADFELTPLTSKSGLSMIVIPADDPAKPSKVFVVEVGQSIRLKGKPPIDPEGVLIYSVDATRTTGNNPVVVYPRKELFSAAYQCGDRFSHPDAPFTLEVLEKKVGAYRIHIQVKD